MRDLVIHAYHLFCVFVMSAFFLLSFLGLGGSFDKWTKRFDRKQRRAKHKDVTIAPEALFREAA